MTYEISFMTANDVAAQIGYRMADWGEGDRATNAWYAPVETYRERFHALLRRATGLGFRSIDLWTSHLNPSWATDGHVAIARDLIAEHGVHVVSLAGWYGATAEEFAVTCRLAVALG